MTTATNGWERIRIGDCLPELEANQLARYAALGFVPDSACCFRPPNAQES